MDKGTKNFLIFFGIIALFAYVLPNISQQQAVVPQAVGDTTMADGIVINTATPTVEWYFKDAILGTAVTPALFRVTINGSSSDLLGTSTINASRGSSYTICLMPNTTYYGTCQSGIVDEAVEKVTLSSYALGTATIWINNDPENSTQRNALGAEDTLATGDTDTPTVCVQGATANASYGDGALLFIFDYNSSQLLTAPTFSVGSLANDKVPMAYVPDTNVGTAKVAYEYLGSLTNQQTVCGSLSVQSSSSAITGPRSHVDVDVYDRATFRHSVTDALEEAYARPTTGVDTNSATNATAVDYFIV